MITSGIISCLTSTQTELVPTTVYVHVIIVLNYQSICTLTNCFVMYIFFWLLAQGLQTFNTDHPYFLHSITHQCFLYSLCCKAEIIRYRAIHSVCMKARLVGHGLLYRKFYTNTETDVLFKLYIADYACEVWSPHLRRDIDELESLLCVCVQSNGILTTRTFQIEGTS